MKAFNIGYGAVGALLAVSVALTGTYGLPKADREIYDTAIELEEKMQQNGFVEFAPSRFKVRFFNGKSDYVVKDGEVTKEEAAFNTFVGTTSEIDGEYQVILPTYENFSDMFSLLDTAQSATGGEMSFGEENYTTNAHVATLWHEAFHAWQVTNWGEEIDAACIKAGLAADEQIEQIVLNEIDSNKQLVVSFSEEMELLIKAYETDDVEEKKQFVTEALAVADEREKQLGKKVAFVENYYEMVEGSARYVEAEAYRMLEGDEVWRETYLGTFTYTNGSGKYYDMGMYKCLLLDQLMPDWKDYFCVTDSLNDYLHSAVGA